MRPFCLCMARTDPRPKRPTLGITRNKLFHPVPLLSQIVIHTVASDRRPDSLFAAPLADARMGIQGGVALRRTFRGLRPLCRKGFRSAPMNAPRRALAVRFTNVMTSRCIHLVTPSSALGRSAMQPMSYEVGKPAGSRG